MLPLVIISQNNGLNNKLSNALIPQKMLYSILKSLKIDLVNILEKYYSLLKIIK